MGLPRKHHKEGHNYVSLREVIVDYMLTMDEDDYASSATEYAIRNMALRGIREFGFDVQPRVRSLKRTLESNNTIVLPDDFVDVIKIGTVDENGIVRAFAENKNLNISQVYDGTVTSQSGLNGLDDSGQTGNRRVVGDNKINNRKDDLTATNSEANNEDIDWYIFENYLYQGGLGRLYGLGGGHSPGEYRINLDQNRIEIATDSQTTDVVIEYIADQARTGNPVVHVYAEEALRCYIYYKLCERKSTVPQGEKMRARAEYYNERRKAKARMSGFSKEEALHTIRKNFKQAPKY